MNDLNQRIARLSPEKRALLAMQLMKKDASVASRQEIPELARTDGAVTFPLSFSQQRLWFLDRLQPGSSFYNISSATRLQGGLDVAALKRSLGEIVKRHESLRTTFASVDEQPVQIISQTMNLMLPMLDLSELPEAERETQALCLASEEAQRPFDLSQGPLLRTSLLRLCEDEHILLLTVHHIISDGWSMGVLFRELKTLYMGYTNEQPAPLHALPVQYADFAVWQRERLHGEALEKQLAYWKQQLAGNLPLLGMLTDRPRPAVQTFKGDMLSAILAQPVTEALKAVSRREGCTLFMTLLAAFQVLLYRYTGQNDILVGSPVAGRSHSEIEGLIGFFINTLVLRTDLSGDPTFTELLRRVREVALGAYTHQDLPFEKLVEELQPERNMSHAPLFQVMFVLHNTPSQPLELAGLKPTRLCVERQTAKFDITMAVIEVEEGLRFQLEYNIDLFNAVTITRLLGHFQILLEGIVSYPSQRISKLPLLIPAERNQILVEWNATRTDHPRAACIHELFQRQAEKTPDATAVLFENRQLSYRELNQRANQLAHHLQTLGVGPDVLVGVCMERSPDMVVALLGILKAGAAYLPLDPVYPEARLAFMVDNAQLPVLVTEHPLAARFIKHKVQLVCLDTDWNTIVINSEANPVNRASADNTAYVIYTSGSTGTPKGVSVPHRAVTRLVINTDYVRLNASDCMAQASNASFDAATFEIWGALLHGARLVIFSKELILSPREFAAQLKAQDITVMFLTTALFNQMAATVPEAFASLQHLLFGGEAVDPRWVEVILKQGPPQRLLHVYGPTESTTFTTWHLVSEIPVGALTLPIGRPIANTQVYLLDKYLQPVPVGVMGEIYVGGDGLAHGYLNSPELTTEKFIRHPFDTDPQARLYKTGDLARYLADGNIEFLGRVDHQVKIRGYRIEPGEVEAVLAQNPAVSETVVLVREDTPGDKRLVAYVVPSDGSVAAIDLASEMRVFLKQALPDYMVPAAIVVIASLPLTPNGKLDRNLLPVPDQTPGFPQAGYQAPRTSLELQLSKLWEKVLKLSVVGVTDNFFDLGGHSLLAVRLVAQIEKALGKNLPLATFFQAPTIEQLAAILGQEGWAPSWSSLVAIQAGGSQPPFFCVHGGGGALLHFRDLVRHLGADQPFYGLQPQGIDGRPATLRHVEEMASFYINELRTLQPDGPYYLGGHCFGGLVALEIAQQLQTQGQQMALLVLIDTPSPQSALDKEIRPPSVLNRFHSKFSLHRQNLSLLEFNNKLLYLLDCSWRKSRNIVMRAIYKVYLRSGTVIPHALRNNYIFDINVAAQRAYCPTVYAGRITLFWASEDVASHRHHHHREGWQQLALGGVDCYDLPASHTTLFYEPQVQVLGEQLKQCIDNARESVSSAGDGRVPVVINASIYR